jgi:hypothetical protein
MSRVWGWLLSGNCPLTPAGNTRRPSEALLVQTPWDDISPGSAIKGFKTAVYQTV